MTLRAPGRPHRPCGKAVAAEGGPGFRYSVAPDSARRAPFFHPLPFPPLPPAVSSAYLPATPPVEACRGATSRAGDARPGAASPVGLTATCAPGPSGSSLSPSSRRRPQPARSRGAWAARCRKPVRHSDRRAETGVAIPPALAVRLQRGVGRGPQRGEAAVLTAESWGAPVPPFGPALPPRVWLVNRSLSAIWE